ncbi:MAG TPA: mechanosensitive ion channel family protein [Tepidisphaeraceae bacterium]|jgi:small-conductance mechanosensitive channel|nr:mechanosensitive ion channel family protein [Tepidisphaeraceae bacterium]
MALLFCSADATRTERSRRRMVWGLLAIVAGVFPAVVAHAATPSQDTGKQLIPFLEREAGWYRQVSTFTHGPVTPGEVLLQEGVAQNAQQAVQQSFTFAQKEAVALSAEGKGSATAPSGNAQNDRLAKLLATATQRVSDYRAQLDTIDQQIRTASAASQPVFTARREKIHSELNLALARQDTLQRLADFASEGTGGSLSHQIEELRSTVPGALGGEEGAAPTTQPAAAAATETAANEPPARLSSMGLLGLVEEMFTLSHKMSDLKGLAAQTDELQKSLEQLRAPFSADLLDAIHRADALAALKDTDDADLLAGQRGELDALTERFNRLSAAAVPLRKAMTYLDTTHSSLLQWRDTVESQYYRSIRYLLTRLAVMGGLILLVLLVSQIWRRATFRYVSDVRRRRQFLFVRRLVVGGTILVVLVAGFITEFGSLATYAGLLTAGIAVALQSVILSGVSHFFFMGRYGVRVGDRVTISGITGDVIDIGIFRMYMMELDGKPNNLQPTGRIVVFSNSVLFQPNAFYKQIPGAEYNWHELGLTLSPDSDYHLAETKLMGAVESVYNQYKARIEQQHEQARNALHVQLATPQIQGRFRFVDSGLEFVVRYPVEMRRAAEIDDQITRSLLDTIEREPRLKLVATSTPKIQAADGAARDSGPRTATA